LNPRVGRMRQGRIGQMSQIACKLHRPTP
jgi:hypothetical protein